MVDQLLRIYDAKKQAIKQRLQEFSRKRSDEELFAEFCFCLFTPQSKARLCWAAVQTLQQRNILMNGTEEEITPHLKSVRFYNNKAKYLVEARKKLQEISEVLKSGKKPEEKRDWLINNVKGYGYKEASHFLRNVGITDVGILDRHILKNLHRYNVIDELPKSLTPKKYLEIEEKMRGFATKIQIPFDELDLLFWSMQTGEIFK